jgi:hypothetical protein
MSFNWAPVFANAKDSIFFVMLTPSKEQGKATELRRLADLANTKVQGAERDEALAGSPVSTGFAVGVARGEIGIMTTAHSVEHLFRAASRPITADQINELFTVQILCSHYENGYRQARSNGVRAYAIGHVVRIDCTHDLMLVRARLADVRRFGGGGGPCQAPHPTMLTCGGDLDPPTHECLMVSWPPYKPDLMSIGRLGTRRTINQISRPNRFEYDFDILEVQMVAGEGSSGAPLVNRRGEVIAVMHGGHNMAHSYFICVHHVKSFLARYGIRPAQPAQAAQPVAA